MIVITGFLAMALCRLAGLPPFHSQLQGTKQMEKNLGQAAPARWRDIAQGLDVASHADPARKQALALIQQHAPATP
jgi:hypothetical protein